MKKILVATVLLLSCKQGYPQFSDSQYARPQSFKYYKTRHFDPMSGLRTDGIYYAKVSDMQIRSFQFFSDGYLMRSYATDVPAALTGARSAAIHNTKRLPSAEMGYYNNQGDSILFSTKDFSFEICYKAFIRQGQLKVITLPNKRHPSADTAVYVFEKY